MSPPSDPLQPLLPPFLPPLVNSPSPLSVSHHHLPPSSSLRCLPPSGRTHQILLFFPPPHSYRLSSFPPSCSSLALFSLFLLSSRLLVPYFCSCSALSFLFLCFFLYFSSCAFSSSSFSRSSLPPVLLSNYVPGHFYLPPIPPLAFLFLRVLSSSCCHQEHRNQGNCPCAPCFDDCVRERDKERQRDRER